MTSVFGTTRSNVQSAQMVVDSAGTTAYAITLSGLSVISLTPTGADTRPAIAAGARGIVNSSDGTPNIRPGSFITISGSNLAAAAVADTLPPPTVLGGSCVTFGDVAVPLLQTSGGEIQAQVPDNLRAGTQVVAVRSLATAQQSDPGHDHYPLIGDAGVSRCHRLQTVRSIPHAWAGPSPAAPPVGEQMREHSHHAHQCCRNHQKIHVQRNLRRRILQECDSDPSGRAVYRGGPAGAVPPRPPAGRAGAS